MISKGIHWIFHDFSNLKWDKIAGISYGLSPLSLTSNLSFYHTLLYISRYHICYVRFPNLNPGKINWSLWWLIHKLYIFTFSNYMFLQAYKNIDYLYIFVGPNILEKKLFAYISKSVNNCIFILSARLRYTYLCIHMNKHSTLYLPQIQ